MKTFVILLDKHGSSVLMIKESGKLLDFLSVNVNELESGRDAGRRLLKDLFNVTDINPMFVRQESVTRHDNVCEINHILFARLNDSISFDNERLMWIEVSRVDAFTTCAEGYGSRYAWLREAHDVYSKLEV